MINKVLFLIKLAVSFLPFVLFAFLNGKVNVKKENRCRQYLMPAVAVIYSVVLLVFLNQASTLAVNLFLQIADLFDRFHIPFVG